MASIKIIRRKTNLQKDIHPIILRVIKDRKIKVITLGLECSENDWDEVNSKFKKSHPNYIQRNRLLLKLQEKALKIIDDYQLNEEDFSLEMFEEKFRGKEISKMTVSEFWIEKIQDLEKAGRIGNAKAYKDTYTSFYKFVKNDKLTFKQLDILLLSKYETYLRSIGNTNGGIGIKMREIRAVYNDAIKKGVTKQGNYPFRDYKIGHFKSKGDKQALTIDEMKRFLQFEYGKYPHLIDSYYYFIFSYYARGMNFKDLMLLKWKNINGNRIEYTRAKTKKKFSISISAPMKEILNYYKSSASSYIFPILLQENLTSHQIANRKHKILSRYNKQLKEIAKIQNIERNITSYVARHTFATHLKFSEVSTDKISQLMGHSDIKVTQHYLSEFGDEELDEAVKKLVQEQQAIYA